MAGGAYQRNDPIHQRFLDALLAKGDQRWKLVRQVIERGGLDQVGFLYETLTSHPRDALTVYFHTGANFPDDEAGTERLALLNEMERRLELPLTKDASGLLAPPPAGKAKSAPNALAVAWQKKRATLIHQHFLYALQGKNREGKTVSGQSRWALARKVVESGDAAHVGYLYETLTRHPEDWLHRYFHNDAVFKDDASWKERTALLNAMEARLGLPASPNPKGPSGGATAAKRPPVEPNHLESIGDDSFAFVYRVGDGAGHSVLMDIVADTDGVKVRWFNFHVDTSFTGTSYDWRLRSLEGGFSPMTRAYDRLGKSLSAAEWRALWPSPVAPLLARYEARSLDIEDAVVVDMYIGLVFQAAVARLDQNEQQVDALLTDQEQIDRRTAYAADLKEASLVRDMLESRLTEVKRTLSRGEHAFTFGLPKPGLGPIPSMPQRLTAGREEGQLEHALGLWMGAFPLLTRFKTGEITGDKIQATLRKIKEDIQETRANLVGDGRHPTKLDPWELANVRPEVNATLGERAKAVIEAEDTSRTRWGWISGGAQLALSIGLLFLPGGAFIDAAIGVAMVAKSWEEAATLGHASNTGLQADAGLVTLFQARFAEAAAMFGTILFVVGTAAQGLKVLRRWRPIAEGAAEGAEALAPAKSGGKGISRLWPWRKLPEEASRESFFEACKRMGLGHVQAELGGLTAKEMELAFGRGPYPRALAELARIPGIGALAKADPARARTLLEAVAQFDRRYVEVFVNVGGGLPAAADALAPILPKARAAVGSAGSKIARGYDIIERAPGAPHDTPDLHLRPGEALDHNGAFHQPGTAPELLGGGVKYAATDRAGRVAMRPGQLLANGVQFQTLDQVAVLGGHGSKFGISGMKPSQVAKMVADELGHAQNGGNIKYLLLDACHQGDSRFVFFGETNAQAVQKALDAELLARGKPPVTVLAAREAGPLYGNQHIPQIPRLQAGKLVKKPFDAVYIPAIDQPGRAYVDARLAATLAGIGALEVGAAVAWTRYMRDKQNAAAQQPAPNAGR